MKRQRLIVACVDATSQHAEQDTPTNVSKFHRCVEQGNVSNHLTQTSLYFAGIKGIFGTPLGTGMWQKAGEVYKAICDTVNNDVAEFRNDPDRLKDYMSNLHITGVGASRGEVAVRMAIGMIYKGGILDYRKLAEKETVDEIDNATVDKYVNEHLAFYKNSYKPKFTESREFREGRSFKPRPFFSLARIDPVSAQVNPHKGLHDYKLNKKVTDVFEAYNLNDPRAMYRAGPLELSANDLTNRKTWFFAGGHMEVVGGVANTERLADCAGLATIKWAKERVGVQFDQDRVDHNFRPNPHACPGNNFHSRETLTERFQYGTTSMVSNVPKMVRVAHNRPVPLPEQIHSTTRERWTLNPDSDYLQGVPAINDYVMPDIEMMELTV